MKYTCGVCSEIVEGNVATLQQHTEKHIVELIKKDNPQWIEENGICPKCLEYYKKQLKGE